MRTPPTPPGKPNLFTEIEAASTQRAFLESALEARAEARQSGQYVSPEVFLSRLDKLLASKQSQKSQSAHVPATNPTSFRRANERRKDSD